MSLAESSSLGSRYALKGVEPVEVYYHDKIPEKVTDHESIDTYLPTYLGQVK